MTLVLLLVVIKTRYVSSCGILSAAMTKVKSLSGCQVDLRPVGQFKGGETRGKF